MSCTDTNIQKVRKLICRRRVGARFTSRDVAKEVGLTSTEAGNILKWQGEVRLIPKGRGQRHSIWEKIAEVAEA